ncbi:MAG TPA: PPK2 family polyphosphate kinase [Chloroflexota bacterium]|nr:PPK2 family polyphosphate kinase [Chloroflexota bacterium]
MPAKSARLDYRATGDKFSLQKLAPRQDGDLTKDTAKPRLKALNARLHDLQELLFAAHLHSVLVILQGMDTSGKGGTIEHVMGGVNPAGCRVVSFKKPTEEDLSHDFLWRIHPHAPGTGMMAIFDRSHYEDVLIARVRSLVPEPIWQARYEQINAFERLLTESGTIVFKFFLHISKEEQLERLKAREEEPDKRWKLSAGDYAEREHWDDYQRAFEVLLERCATKESPWYVVPSDRKWFRNLAVAETLVERLSSHEDEWRQAVHERGERNHQALLKYRETHATV